MRIETKSIKEQIWSFEEMYDRAKVLKDKFKGETAYICTAGPTFNTFSEELLKEKLGDKLVISIKQTQDKLKDITDIHLLNFVNLSNYKYSNPNTIVAWAVWDNQQPHTIIQNFPVDFILDTFKLNDGSPNIENTLAATEQWDQMDMNNNFARPWGPGTMYEMAIPMALYMGCTKIVTIGWDLFKNTLNSPEKGKNDWCYKEITHESTKTQGSLKELNLVKNSTKSLYEWLLKKGVELVIVDPDGDNPAYEKIKRTKTI